MKKLVPTMKKHVLAMRKQLLTLVLGCALVVLVAPVLVSCKDRIGGTVTFSMDGGIPAVKDKIVETGKLLTKPTPEPTKEGYAFAGWFKDKELTQAFNFCSEKITDNITLYAKWDVATYTVTLNYNDGGTEPDLQKSVNHGQNVEKPNPTREGYTFEDWYSDETLTTVFDFNANTIIADITLYAKWDVATYTVTLNYNDGGTETDLQKSVNHGQNVEKPNPTREGYTFEDWYSDETLTTVFDFNANTIIANITLYAKWDAATYTVNFNSNGGTKIDSDTIEHEKTVSRPTDPTREGYVFENWYSDEILTTVFDFNANTIIADITLYAKWDAATYTVNFNSNGGTKIDSDTIEHEKTVSRPADPTREGYVFENWYSDETLPTPFDFDANTIIADITLYAKWDVATYTVNFNSNGGTKIDSDTIEHEKTVSRPADPTREGYVFEDWYSDEILTTVFDFNANTIIADITLYAKWDVATYTVNFNSNGGTSVDQQTVERGKKASRPADPTREGYVFENWHSDETLPTPFDFDANTIIADITLYAKWDVATYTVNFNSNGGTSVDQQTVERGKKASRPTDPTREGYVFENWYSDETLTTVFDFNANTIIADITLYAKWDVATYTVNFNSNGGTSVDQQTVERGKKASRPTDPTREDYVFENWHSDEALHTPFDFDANTIIADITLYAKWDVATYTVNFNSNGGTKIDSDTIEHEKTVSRPADPTREGYVFENWYSDETLTTVFDFNANTIIADITLYAKWDAATYTVNFNSNGGTKIDSDTIEHEKTVSRPADPTREGYVFENWYSDETLTTVFDFNANTIIADITLYAKWDAATYTVNFNSNGGTKIDSDTIEHEKTVSRPADPTREGYVFEDWHSDETLTTVFDFNANTIIADITLYAKWDVATYTVNFNSNGGTKIDSDTIEHEKTVSRPADPTREGYVFENWYSDETLATVFDFDANTIIADITLYAKWDVATYTVNFNSNGGTSVDQQTVERGKKASRPTDPTREGYTFANWYSDEALATLFDFDANTIIADITLYAKWDVATYTVNFNSNGGTSVDQQTVERGKKASRPTDPTREGYVFENWYSDEILTTVFDFNANTIIADITLYAKWDAATYTVNFNSNGGTKIDSDTIEHEKTVSRPADPTREGYVFENWYSDETLTTVFDFNANTIIADITLYAKWDAATYTVNFNSNGGTKIDSDTIEHEKTVSRPADPTREGYVFEDWHSDETLTTVFDFNANTIIADITLYAKWDVATYTVNFNSNGGTKIDSDTIEHEKTVSRPADPTREGYVFENWYSDETLATVFDFDANTIIADITLYAKWDVATYTVNFNSNGGTSVDQQTVERGKKASRPTDPTREGYTFANWYSDEALATPFDFDANTIIADITLYAKWDVATYTVNFNSNGGTSVDQQTVERGKKASRPTDPTREDYVFENWHSDEALPTPFDFDANTIIADITLYAKWKAHFITIPDANFRHKLQMLMPTAFVGEKLDVTSDKVTGLRQLNVSTPKYRTDTITDLRGIRYFIALTKLNCSGNRLADLDVSKNTMLTTLECNRNRLTDLDVSKNTMLTTLECNKNRLTDLDVSKNTMLTTLECNRNRLTDLDVSKNTMLTTLECNKNRLTDLDVSKNTMLTTLECNRNRLTDLDVSKNTALTVLDCGNNSNLAGLDVSTNTALTLLYCNSNGLTDLDVSTNTVLTMLLCNNNRLTGLDIRGIRNATQFEIHSATGETNIIKTLKVHETLKDYDKIKEVKTARDDKVTIFTYSASAGSTTYTAVCNDYDPTADDGTGGKGVCNDTP